MDAPMFFSEIFDRRKRGEAAGIYSVCSANHFVIEAALEQAQADGSPLLIEATANQVNQFGGYTGLKPGDFIEFVREIAEKMDFPFHRILFGGDHLGPLTWQDKSEGEAMALACQLVRQYVLAGFTKIHLDTSMRLADDDPEKPLTDRVMARRGAQLCLAAEAAAAERKKACPSAAMPVYVIGSEVPTPGGMQASEPALTPTTPQAFLASYAAFEEAFSRAGLADASSRIVAFVVQPGVEFSGEQVFDYDRAAAAPLCSTLGQIDRPMLFEGHSTDYQRPARLRQMVEDGIGILKVGPALTYALRQGLMALEMMEQVLVDGTDLAASRFSAVLEATMLRYPENWERQYTGSLQAQKAQRLYSYYDRARYYLGAPEVEAATATLLGNLDKTGIPLNIMSQYLPQCYEICREGLLAPKAEALLRQCIRNCLEDYSYAVGHG